MSKLSKVFKRLLRRCEKKLRSTDLPAVAAFVGASLRANLYGSVDRGNVECEPIDHAATSTTHSNMANTTLQWSLEHHFAASKIQSAYRNHMICLRTKASSSIIDRSSVELNRDNHTLVLAASSQAVAEVATTTPSPRPVDNSTASDIQSANQDQLPRKASPLKELVKFHLRVFWCWQAMFQNQHQSQVNNVPGIKSPDYEGSEVGSALLSDQILETASWKYHLEPKSRHRTLQQYLGHVPVIDCSSYSSSSFGYSERWSSSIGVASPVPVYLNVYDMTAINACTYWLGLGAHHSGIQVYGVEYAYGMDDSGQTGVFRMLPTRCEGFKFRKSILVGYTELALEEVTKVMAKLGLECTASCYNIIANNCNHFCNKASIRLTGNETPYWVNRLAGIASLFVIPLTVSRRKKRIYSRTKGKKITEKDEKLFDSSKKFLASSNSSSFSSSISSEVIVVGKSSRLKRSVSRKSSLDQIL